MRFIVFFASMVAASAFRSEVISTPCFWVSFCMTQHAHDIEARINKDANYVSHSTLNTKVTVYSILIFKS
jgi:hypothetical protein